MNGSKSKLVTLTAAWLLASLACASPATAGMVTPEPPRTPRMEPAPDELKNITIDERLNTTLPLDLTFTDERNQPVRLGQYFTGKKPVVLQLGYYGCPMLCDLVSRGLTQSLKPVELTPGADFEIVFISIDPNETWQLAQGKKRAFLREYDRPGTDGGWHFLTGRPDQIERIARAVGFNYKWVPSAGQFSHPAAIAIATPEGRPFPPPRGDPAPHARGQAVAVPVRRQVRGQDIAAVAGRGVPGKDRHDGRPVHAHLLPVRRQARAVRDDRDDDHAIGRRADDRRPRRHAAGALPPRGQAAGAGTARRDDDRRARGRR
jgi:cytochrome oxidase Cu insertion factor (SCO1/SenC/PrrC family)